VKKRKNKSNYISAVAFVLSAAVLRLPEPVTLFAQEAAPSRGMGKIVGKVRLGGSFKKPPALKVYKNRDFCGAEVPNESLAVGPGGALQNVVVTIPRARVEKKVSPLRSLVLDNKNCAFVPHVQVATVGSEVLLLNSDPILHDVHARIGPETLFNVGLPTWRQVKKQLTRTGIIRIECDVLHTWMSAYIVVTASPYFAVTDAEGEFVIDGVLPGSYEIQVWHEKLGRQSRRLTVTGDSLLRIDLVYQYQ
jgi:hypothetical protein